MRQVELLPAFVDDIPERLPEGQLYISRRHAIAIHLCCCGCRGEVVTPFSPVEWCLTVRGTDVTLFPSIGNWGFPCRSHYWIRSNRVEWALPMSDLQIATVRARDRADLEGYIARSNAQRAEGRSWWKITQARFERAWKWLFR